jgi:ABC-2 type transport system permease protein
MSLRRTAAILRKELWHITRDVRVLFLVTLAPAFLLLMLSYVFSFDFERVRAAVLDWDGTPISREYVSRISADGDFVVQTRVNDLAAANDLVLRGDVNMALIIPRGFGAAVENGRGGNIQAIVDGSNPITARQAVAQLSARTSMFAAARLSASGQTLQLVVTRQDVDARERAWYNPAMKSLPSMVPGLLAIVLFMPAMAVTLALAREKETGSFEGLIATPVRGIEYLAGKLLAYALMGLAGTVAAWLIAVLWFRVPFQGDVGTLLAATCLYFWATMSIGILIAHFVTSQQTAMTLFLLAFFIPSFFIAGLISPIDYTSVVSRLTSSSIPPTHFVIITRAIFLKGLGLRELWQSALALALMGGGAMTLSLLLFKKKIT